MLHVTGLCAGNSPGTGEFPAQMASYAENVSIWWRHHEHKINSGNLSLDHTGGNPLLCTFRRSWRQILKLTGTWHKVWTAIIIRHDYYSTGPGHTHLEIKHSKHWSKMICITVVTHRLFWNLQKIEIAWWPCPNRSRPNSAAKFTVIGRLLNTEPCVTKTPYMDYIYHRYLNTETSGGCFTTLSELSKRVPDSKVDGADMGPTWVLSAPDGPHGGPMNLAIRGTQGVSFSRVDISILLWWYNVC